jgi:hypothetical protein
MENKPSYSSSERNFILQQGFAEPQPESCPLQYSSLLFQPRLVGLWSLLGVILQSPMVFLGLSAVLLWSAFLPRLNPFEALYNITFAKRPGAIRLTPAPVPRRFAQGMAGTFALTIGILLVLEWNVAAYTFEAALLMAVAALAFGKFCLGSFVFHLLRGRADFARRTLPWARGNQTTTEKETRP